MSTDIVYVAAALLGALVGGLVSFAVSARSARRERRARYGEALLAALSAAQRKLTNTGADAKVQVRDEALTIWVQAELAATLELPAGRRAMQAWGAHFYELLGETDVAGRMPQWLDQRLDLSVYLVIAWTAGHARGGDFALPADELRRRFAPQFRESDFSAFEIPDA